MKFYGSNQIRSSENICRKICSDLHQTVARGKTGMSSALGGGGEGGGGSKVSSQGKKDNKNKCSTFTLLDRHDRTSQRRYMKKI